MHASDRLLSDRHAFRIEADADIDVLLKVLGPFAVQGAAPVSLRHEQSDHGAWITLETDGLGAERAELLALRLAQIPAVRSVEVRACHAQLAAAK